jgi:hypothetical protein
MDETMRATLMHNGVVYMPSDYGSMDPYPITKHLIEDGRKNLILQTKPLILPFPVRLLHGTADKVVKDFVTLSLLHHAEGNVSEFKHTLYPIPYTLYTIPYTQ